MRNRIIIWTAYGLFLTVVILVIAALCGEIYARLTGKYGLAAIEYSPIEIWHWKKNLSYKSRSEEGFETIIHTDRFGFRNYGKAVKKPADVIRIVVIGDSYTEGLGYGDDQIFTSLLEKKLQDVRVNGKKIEVLGASSPAWSTEQELLCLKNEAQWLGADYVLLMVCPNDIREAYCKKFVEMEPSGELKFNPIKFSRKEIYNWKLAAHSSLYQLLQDSVFRTNYGTFESLDAKYKFNFGVGDSTNWDRPVFLKSSFPDLDNARRLFIRLLDKMKETCDKDHIGFAISVTPLVIEFDSTMIRDTAMQSGYVSALVQHYCDSSHIGYVNLYDRFKLDTNPTSFFLKSDEHFNAKGHQVTADALAEYYHKLFRNQ